MSVLPGKPCLVLWMNRECELPAELLSLPVILMDDAVNDEEWWPDFLGWLTLRPPTGTICIYSINHGNMLQVLWSIVLSLP